MNRAQAEEFATTLFTHLTNRPPQAAELAEWIAEFSEQGGVDATRKLRDLVASTEAHIARGVHSRWLTGHFYSPVVDPRTVGPYVEREWKLAPHDIAGIDLDVDAMLAFWRSNLDLLRSTPFQTPPGGANRYYSKDSPYPLGDAAVLRMMIHHRRPRRIIEIGSGFSTAAILDSLDHAGLTETQVTCIEPFPKRLMSLMRPQDKARVAVIEKIVQEVDPAVVDTLVKGDILLIDSTHVLKTGSDVHCELFHLLPRLRPGVAVHFHDVRYPFEYNKEFIFDYNHSWNEAYALRAFLMYNQSFSVIFWNTLLWQAHGPAIRTEWPQFPPNPGSAIWIERSDAPGTSSSKCSV